MRVLYIIGGIFIAGFIFVFIYSYKNLDMQPANSLHQLLDFTAHGQEDYYAKAMLPYFKQVRKPIIILMPYAGDRYTTDFLEQYLKVHDKTLADLKSDASLARRLFEANSFSGKFLATGKLRSLDGTFHQVICDSEGKSCSIGKRKATIQLSKDDGSMYVMSNLKTGDINQDIPFLPFF